MAVSTISILRRSQSPDLQSFFIGFVVLDVPDAVVSGIMSTDWHVQRQSTLMIAADFFVLSFRIWFSKEY